MKLSKITVLAAAMIFAAGSIFGAEAYLKSFNGKVEIKKGTSWTVVKEGDKIEPGTIISTGFNSNAVIMLGKSEIFIKPLTRISLDEISTSSNIIKTKLNLSLGKIKAEINTTEGLKNDFMVRTPVSTASVKGTVFEVGLREISVESGRIAYSNNIGQTVSVASGTSSSAPEGGFAPCESPMDNINAAFTIETSTQSESGSSVGDIAPGRGENGAGMTVIIKIIDMEALTD